MFCVLVAVFCVYVYTSQDVGKVCVDVESTRLDVSKCKVGSRHANFNFKTATFDLKLF